MHCKFEMCRNRWVDWTGVGRDHQELQQNLSILNPQMVNCIPTSYLIPIEIFFVGHEQVIKISVICLNNISVAKNKNSSYASWLIWKSIRFLLHRLLAAKTWWTPQIFVLSARHGVQWLVQQTIHGHRTGRSIYTYIFASQVIVHAEYAETLPLQ